MLGSTEASIIRCLLENELSVKEIGIELDRDTERGGGLYTIIKRMEKKGLVIARKVICPEPPYRRKVYVTSEKGENQYLHFVEQIV